MDTFFHILAILICYLLGAVPFGLFFSKLYSDVDVRTVGSGNIGATNVLRAAGKKAAILTLLSDTMKGLISVDPSHTYEGEKRLLCHQRRSSGSEYPRREL